MIYMHLVLCITETNNYVKNIVYDIVTLVIIVKNYFIQPVNSVSMLILYSQVIN